MKENNDLIHMYYRLEEAALVSPHGLRKKIDSGDENFLLVDLRSAEEFKRARIKNACNVPAYSSPDTPAYEQVERIVSEFRALPKDKQLILYCYSKYCMTGRKVGKMLADNGIFAKHLGLGWNEWRYKWTEWNHEHEWTKTKVENYIEGEQVDIKSTEKGEGHPDDPFSCLC